ncbi:protein LONGIFOLIA 1-like isoform X1 [Brassica napus]|uniref:protein LONGIFOLIA 1-like isoform X1 n=1 Tax=Brassica napus TaxID=3708 RepID=UPI000BBE2C0A|nr:protein LONGIFOLIA 1-like isoform X1 [Brassica napus]XP_022558637.1 protein LONGIFOLIA 1-like isoform X1 [Brassica napus]
MAAKLLHSLADDSADLQKQIGCMNGIFQIFDRHHVLTGRRKSLTLGSGNANSINIERDSVDTFYQAKDTVSLFLRVNDLMLSVRSILRLFAFQFQDTNIGVNVKEKQRVSTESSRVSFSSSCSSSPSSPELIRGVQPEASAYDQANFPESPTSDSEMAEGNGFSQLGFDLRDVVRDSMYRDARGLSLKTPMTREEVVRRSRREDSPRPYGLKQSTPADLSESFRFLAKLRESPHHYNEVGVKGAPARYSVDSHDTLKSRQKLKELPRLSLDSRERVVQNSVVDLKPVKLPESSSSSNKKRPPSVVAKLMGLETLPGSPVGRDIHKLGLNTFDDNNDPFSRSLREKNLNRTIRFSPSSPRSLGKDPSSPRWRNSDFVMKPLSSSRFPIEPAPWKQADRNRVLQKQPVKAAAPPEVAKFPPTVYSEMERRLNDLEFKDSGKDLRALKQILEAMQSKVLLDTEKQPQSSNMAAQRDYATSNQETTSRTRVPSSSSNQVYQSPIVIMKPAKLVEKAGIPASSLIPIHSLSGGLNKIRREKPDDKGASTSSKRVTKDSSSGKGRAESSLSSVDKKPNSRNVPSSSKKPHKVTKESGTSKSSGSVSPRLQQKKLEHDKRSRPPTPPSDSTKSRKPLNRQMAESTSPGGRRRPKAQKSLQQSDDLVSQGSNESRTSSHDMCTHSEAEAATVIEQASVMEAAKAVVSNLMHNKSSPRFSEDGSSANLSLVALEHPSPISVLDTSIYREMEPSPVKTQGYVVAHDSGDDEQCEDQWNPAYSFSETTSTFSPEINRKKLQNVEHLVQKLRRLNSTHDEANQDYIASLCETSDPNTDHRYISEILLASGLLLRDLGSGLTTFQLHPSGHPINPELFYVLEQTKGSSNTHLLLHKEESKALNKEKLNRKLVFDTVNELLVEKLASVEATTNPLMKSSAKKAMSAQQLLKELCTEIESLQRQATKRSENFLLEEEDDFLKSILAEDVMIRSGNWVDFSGEFSGLVLDVERLIFKDLVSEIVHAETSRLQAKSGRRRTLFSGQ